MALPRIMYLNVLTDGNAFKPKQLQEFMKKMLPQVVPWVKDQGTEGVSPFSVFFKLVFLKGVRLKNSKL